jgi:hypothetical protein
MPHNTSKASEASNSAESSRCAAWQAAEGDGLLPSDPMSVEPAISRLNELPGDLDQLVQASLAEGFRFLERLRDASRPHGFSRGRPLLPSARFPPYCQRAHSYPRAPTVL